MDSYSFKINIDGVDKIITSVSEANKLIKELTEKIILAKESGQDFSVALSKLNEAFKIRGNISALSSGISNLSTSLGHSQTASANAAQALLNLNYVIRDSPYFFQNFALGILAVGNNLNPLIDSFSRLRAEAGERAVSSFTLLKQALVGGAGISIAFSVVVTAIQAFVFWMNRSKDETENTSKKIQEQINILKSLKEEYDKVNEENRQYSNILSITTAKRYNELKLLEQAKKNIISATELQLGTTAGETERFKLLTRKGTAEEELKRIQSEISFLEFAMKKSVDKLFSDQIKAAQESKEKSLQIFEQQMKLYNELVLLSKDGREKELEQLRQKYEEWLKTAKDNQQLIKLAEETFRKEMLEINLKYDRKDLDEWLKFWERRNEGLEKQRKERAGRFADVVKPKEMPEEKKFKFKMTEEIGKQGLEEAGRRMEYLKMTADILGDSLTSAFQKGKVVLEEFIVSLGLAIAKFLTLQAIAAFFNLPSIFTGGASAGAAGAVGAIPKININVGGSMRMSGRDFVIQFKQIENNVNNSRI